MDRYKQLERFQHEFRGLIDKINNRGAALKQENRVE